MGFGTAGATGAGKCDRAVARIDRDAVGADGFGEGGHHDSVAAARVAGVAVEALVVAAVGVEAAQDEVPAAVARGQEPAIREHGDRGDLDFPAAAVVFKNERRDERAISGFS